MATAFHLLVALLLCLVPPIRCDGDFVVPPAESSDVDEPTYGQGWELDIVITKDVTEWSSQYLCLYQYRPDSDDTFDPVWILEDVRLRASVAWQVSPEKYGYDTTVSDAYYLQMCPSKDTGDSGCIRSKKFFVEPNLPRSTVTAFTWTNSRLYTVTSVQTTISPPTITSTSTSTRSSITSTPTSPTAAAATSPTLDPGLSSGAKAGVGVGVVLGVAAIGVIVLSAWLLLRRRRKESQDERDAYKYEPQMNEM